MPTSVTAVPDYMAAFQWTAGLAIFDAAHADVWVSGLIGVVGAVLGSLVTIAWTEWFNARTRKRSKREQFRAAAFAIYHRLNRIYSTALTFRDHLRQGIELARREPGRPLCAVVQPVNKQCAPVAFTIDELWAVAQAGETDLLNSVASLDDGFNGLLDLMERYEPARRAVFDAFTPVGTDGEVTTVEIDPEAMRRLAPDIAALDKLIVDTAQIAGAIVDDSFKALTLLIRCKAKPFGPAFTAELVRGPEGRPVRLSAADRGD